MGPHVRQLAITAEAATHLRGLFHDIGHDLATVSFLVSAVQGDPTLAPDTRQRVLLIEREIERLQHLVADERGGSESSGVSVRQVLADVVDPIALTVAARVVLCPGPDLVLPVSESVLWRVVVNLVDNAVRAAGSSGCVEVALEPHPQPTIEVRDDGPGFGRGPAGWARNGLEIVRALVDQWGARVSFGSRPEGGARVLVTFPPGFDQTGNAVSPACSWSRVVRDAS